MPWTIPATSTAVYHNFSGIQVRYTELSSLRKNEVHDPEREYSVIIVHHWLIHLYPCCLVPEEMFPDLLLDVTKKRHNSASSLGNASL